VYKPKTDKLYKQLVEDCV